jgi:hypothetical protein
MRCKNCDHSLWNQPVPPEGTGRVCSECGTPYAAADFDYGRGKVRFCCPGCTTGYYGTSERGHLEPAEFDCIGCGAHLNMERCIIRAHNMERENEAMQQRDLPWLEEGSLGWIRRWWRTTSLSLSNAPNIVPLLNRPPKPLLAAVFALINTFLASAIASGIYGLFPMLFPGGRFTTVDPYAIGVALVGILASSLAITVFCAIPAICCCWITRKGEPLGFARGYELSAYSTGALLFVIIPCCGFLIGPVVWAAQSIGVFVAYFGGESLGTRILAGVCSAAGFIATVGGGILFLTYGI